MHDAVPGASLYRAAKGIDSSGRCRACDDLMRYCMESFRIAFDEGADSCIAFGHPRAAIKEAGGIEEGRGVNLDDGMSEGR